MDLDFFLLPLLLTQSPWEIWALFQWQVRSIKLNWRNQLKQDNIYSEEMGKQSSSCPVSCTSPCDRVMQTWPSGKGRWTFPCVFYSASAGMTLKLSGVQWLWSRPSLGVLEWLDIKPLSQPWAHPNRLMVMGPGLQVRCSPEQHLLHAIPWQLQGASAVPAIDFTPHGSPVTCILAISWCSRSSWLC